MADRHGRWYTKASFDAEFPPPFSAGWRRLR